MINKNEEELYDDDLPFVCGDLVNCTGKFEASDKRWNVRCNNFSKDIGIASLSKSLAVHSRDHTVERVPAKNETIIRCLGPAYLVLKLSSEQFSNLK